MIDDDFNSLIGSKVLSAEINDENDLVMLMTDKGKFYLEWSGDCCAHCFLAHVNNVDALIGATIMSIEHAEWIDISNQDDEYDKDNGNVIESMGTIFKTDKGTVEFESRVKHNGYYGGRIEVNTKESEYASKYGMKSMKSLKDF